MEQKPYFEYTLKQSSQFKKDLKAVKFDEHKLDELLKEIGLTKAQAVSRLTKTR